MAEDKKDEELDEMPEAAVEEETGLDEPNELEALKADNARLREDYLRASAEVVNTRTRCQAEMEKNSRFAVSSFAKELLLVADNLERAIAAVPEDKRNDNPLLAGVELTRGELAKAFAKFGIERMETRGKIFDPNLHQVISEVENKKAKPGEIIEEVLPGYTISDRILRAAMVVVAKK